MTNDTILISNPVDENGWVYIQGAGTCEILAQCDEYRAAFTVKAK